MSGPGSSVTTCAARLSRVLSVALPVRDVLEQRVDEAVVPAWCERRGWAPFLLDLDEATVRAAEANGLAEILPRLVGAPQDLLELGREVTATVELPRLHGATPLAAEALRSVRFRKRAQLSGLLSAVANMAEGANRIVDVGAGSGHFTRLSAELFQREALGLELGLAVGEALGVAVRVAVGLAVGVAVKVQVGLGVWVTVSVMVTTSAQVPVN